LNDDPDELHNLADDPAHVRVREDLIDEMVAHFYGDDLSWVRDGRLVGLPDRPFELQPNRSLNGQRGWRFM
jgi:arylsulfatase